MSLSFYEVLKKTTEMLEAGAVDGGEDVLRREAELLVAHVLQCSLMELYLTTPTLSEFTHHQLLELIKRRCLGEPIAYILGYVEFYGERFKVSKDTLIPRPETEELICLIRKQFSKKASVGFILDLGTGSGCIALCLARMFPLARVYGVDVCEKALEVARENARILGLEHRVRFFLEDIAQDSFWQGLRQTALRYDLIVSNPPYVRTRERDLLSAETRHFEPWKALHGGEEGIDYYKLMQPHIHHLLSPKASVFAVEMGLHHGKVLRDLYQSPPYNSEGYRCQVHADLQHQERFMILSYALEGVL